MAELNVVNQKNVRFAKVVDTAGKPEPYTLWKDPARDSEFQKAIRGHRLMTVLRQRSRPDAAIVGYLKKPNASYLLFPKSLEQFADRRVVGLKYDLLTEPMPKGKPVRGGRRKQPTFKPARPKRAGVETSKTSKVEEPAKSRLGSEPETLPAFHVQAQVAVTFDREVEVRAKNQREARRAALEALEQETLDRATGTKQIRIKKIRKK